MTKTHCHIKKEKKISTCNILSLQNLLLIFSTEVAWRQWQHFHRSPEQIYHKTTLCSSLLMWSAYPFLNFWYLLENFDQLTDHKPWKVIFIETKVIISSLNLTWKQMYSVSQLHRKKFLWMESLKEITVDQCLVFQFCSAAHLQIKHTHSVNCIRYLVQSGLWLFALCSCTVSCLFLFKNIKQYFQPAPPGPQLNNNLRLWEKWVEVVQTPQGLRGCSGLSLEPQTSTGHTQVCCFSFSSQLRDKMKP